MQPTSDVQSNPISPSGKRHTHVVVILLTLNQREKTLRCLESLRHLTYSSYAVLVWDNGSTDGTDTAIQTHFPEVMLVRHPSNLGVASGRNAASKHAIEQFTPEYLFFMDNDMTVSATFLEPLLAPFKANPRLAQTTGKIKDYNEVNRIYGAGGCRLRFWTGDTMHVGYGEQDAGQYETAHVCLPSGGCMMIRADVFQLLGGFDPIFDPYGPEDLDLGLRASDLGYHAVYVPTSVVYHDSTPGHTFEGGAYSKRYAAFKTRHWLTLMHRHASPVQIASFYLIGAPYVVARLLLRESRRGNLVPVLRGLWDGLRASSLFAKSS